MKTELNPKLKRLDYIAYAVSVVVIVLVVLMRRVKIDLGFDFSFLPPLHASLNAITAILLVLAFLQIKKKKIEVHKKLMITAMITSVLFLISYVLYHFTTEETRFCKEGSIRYVYFFLLITHVILAGIILPFILITFNRGFLMVVEKHRKLAKWVYPLWLYVAITGPVLYLMLMPCYN